MSAVRWAVLDHLYHWTGIPEPKWDFRRLPATLAAFESHVEDHYRYYQFYSNLLIALTVAYLARLVSRGHWPGQGGWQEVGYLLIVVILVFASRDAMRKYYRRTAVLLASAHAGKMPKED